MRRGSTRPAPGKWDIARLPAEEGSDATAAWTETFAARVLGAALTEQPEFWEHVSAIRGGVDAKQYARQYVRRDQGRRVELLAAYLERAATADERAAAAAVWNIAVRAWPAETQTPSDPRAPRRALRDDAEDSMTRAAFRVARRGARRCAALACCVDPSTDTVVGAKLARDASGDYCTICAPRQPHPRSDVEAERVLFDRAIYAVLGADDSRARRRRTPTRRCP